MANLAPVIRYRKFQLDEKRRFIARLYSEADKVYAFKQKALDEVSREKKFVSESDDPYVITEFLSYQGLMKKKIGIIQVEIGRIDARIQIAQDDLREEFTELKKFEIVHRRRLERKREELERRESILLDAQAVEAWRRNQDAAALETA
jgi:hypothetical protein